MLRSMKLQLLLCKFAHAQTHTFSFFLSFFLFSLALFLFLFLFFLALSLFFSFFFFLSLQAFCCRCSRCFGSGCVCFPLETQICCTFPSRTEQPISLDGLIEAARHGDEFECEFPIPSVSLSSLFNLVFL